MNGKIKTKFAALFAVALMITVCVVPVVGNEDVQAADVSSTIPEGISDIEIQFFTEDSTDFSDMIYSANGSKLPASVDPVEWKQVENGSVYINVNKDSEYFGKFLRFGQTGLSNEEIVKIAKAGGQLPLIQTSWMYSDAVDVDIFVNGVEKDGGAPSLTKAGATFVSPFVGRLDDICEDGIGLVSKIVDMYRYYGYGTEVLAASIRHTQHIVACLEAGADVATCPLAAIEGLLKHPLTDAGLSIFNKAAESMK